MYILYASLPSPARLASSLPPLLASALEEENDISTHGRNRPWNISLPRFLPAPCPTRNAAGVAAAYRYKYAAGRCSRHASTAVTR